MLKKSDQKEVVQNINLPNFVKAPIYQGDVIGKYDITINGKNYWITAIIDTGFDLDRYVPLTEKKEHKTNAEQLVDYIISKRK